MVDWAHALLAPVLAPGDLAVDLTAGTGRDTRFLWQQVAPGGRVVAFDIQRQALLATAGLLQAEGMPVRFIDSFSRVASDEPGVCCLQACHGRLGDLLEEAPRAVVANLGYLPGGDPAIVTREATTLPALAAAAALLSGGGRLVVAVYPGHPGGDDEGRAVERWFGDLPARTWDVLHLASANRAGAPFLLAAEKHG